MIYLGADHRGFKLKEKMKTYVQGLGLPLEDLGDTKFDPNDDYTFYAERVARRVQEHISSFGILFCGSGVGVDVTANKFDGIRASIGKSAEQIEAGRKDDDMNVLVIAADFTSETDAKDMIRKFLETKFDEEERHERRIKKIEEIEKTN